MYHCSCHILFNYTDQLWHRVGDGYSVWILGVNSRKQGLLGTILKTRYHNYHGAFLALTALGSTILLGFPALSSLLNFSPQYSELLPLIFVFYPFLKSLTYPKQSFPESVLSLRRIVRKSFKKWKVFLPCFIVYVCVYLFISENKRKCFK